MTEPRQLAVVRSYDELLDAMRAQVQALGINYAMLDLRAGYTSTYATKLLSHAHHVDRSEGGKRIRSGRRSLSPEAFDAFLDALGFDLIAVENPQKAAKTKAWLASRLEHGAHPEQARMLPMRRMPRPTWLITPKKSHHMNRLRHEKVTAERRSEIARMGGKARWKKPQIVEITGKTTPKASDGKQPRVGALKQVQKYEITRAANKKKS